MSSQLILTAAAAFLATAPAIASPAAETATPDAGPPARTAGAQVIPIVPRAAPDPDAAPLATGADVDAAPAAAPPAPQPGGPPDVQDIMEVAAANPDLTTLATALRAADLAQTLKGPGPFTLFAPSNEAFARLPAGTLEDLLKPENRARLVRILTYHVAPSAMLTANMTGASATPASVAGPPLAVDGRAGISVNGAKVIGTQTIASNGVVHIIDAVLEPR